MATDLGWKVFDGSSIPNTVDSARSREAHPVIATVDPDAGLPPPALNTLFAEAHAATGAEDLAALMHRLMALVMAQTRAQRCVLLVTDPVHDPTGEAVESQRIEAECTAGGPVHVLCGERLVDQAPHAAAAPQRAVNFVVNSRQRLTLADVSREVPFDSDPAVTARQICSLLCLPLRQPGRLLGVLYLENLPDPDLLAPEQVDAATLLATQAALSVQNAWLLENAGGGGQGRAGG